MENILQTAIFGGGCFWCTEAVFKSLIGVTSVVPGYSGGTTENPTYEEVCSGNTGHAEVIKIEFDPKQVSFRDLLEVFFSTHDPTTVNRQGNDIGEQYRSVIFYTSDQQKEEAEKIVAELESQKVYNAPVVTLIQPLQNFYEAESYHRDYFAKNSEQPYCQIIINPKLEKFRKHYARLVKK